jgi:hypothetical protein
MVGVARVLVAALQSGRLYQDDAQGPGAVHAFDALELDVDGGTAAADPGER